ncbi:terminase large subunit domain-containing protein, partial [Capnocytophaga gingivalis]
MRSLATDLLWKIVNGEEIQRGGKTHVASLRESLTAISLLGRMEGWFLRSEERKMKNEEAKVKNEECSQPVSTAQSQPTLTEQTQYITPAFQHPLLLEEKNLAFNLLTFTQKTLPYFKPAPFHRTYYEKLTDFALGRIQKLIITMPPQHGKSEGATRRLPAFVLGCNPNKRIAIVSYNATKARKFNRELQRIMDQNTYHELFPQATLARAPSSQAARKSRNYARNADECEIVGYQGSFKTIGVGGSLTGEPVDILIMDDLYKDAAAAWSPLIRQNIADWYDTVASTRLHNSSQQLLVFTRWHEDDLAGRLLQKEGLYHPTDNPHGWVLLSFPAIKDSPPTPLDPRTEGEVLWPERHNLEKLLQIKQRNGAVFESLYQQNPQPSQGLMYEEFQCYTESPSRTYSVAYIDAADS